MEDEAAEEEAKDKQLKAGLAKKALKKRMGSQDGTTSAPSGAQLANPALDGLIQSSTRSDDGKENRSSEAVGDDGEDRDVNQRTRASEFHRF